MKRVAVLMGGPSSEHDISIKSGTKVLSVLDDPVRVEIGRDGRWSVDGQLMDDLGSALQRLAELADVAFVALHGPFGEDGTVQGLLEVAGVPYTGSGVLGSSLAMDKVRTKLVYRACGLPTPEFLALDRRAFQDLDQVVRKVESELGFPAVVKPACDGSSVGVSFPKDVSELTVALNEAKKSGRGALVEQYIRGRELTCGILEHDGQVEALPVTEIIPGAKYSFFDFEAKYTPGATDEVTPARIPDSLRDEVQRIAVEAHNWLGCRDFSRTDFMVGEDGKALALETNTIPGLTPTSLLPQAAEVAGYSFEVLIQTLVANARARRVS